VNMQGWGLYRNDSVFSGAAFRGTDAVTLLVCLPLLVVSFIFYRRGSLRGGLLLIGSLAYFLYNSASMALGAAFNSLLLLYILWFVASLFSFTLAFNAVDLQALAGQITTRAPWRGTGIFLLVVGTMTALLWLSELIPAMIAGQPPVVTAAYTTVITFLLDLGIIVPAVLLAGALLLKRQVMGFLIGVILLTLLVQVGMVIIGQTIFQINAGIVFNMGQVVGMIGTWIVMGALAVFFAAALLRSLAGGEGA
jgi:hypothetical protein